MTRKPDRLILIALIIIIGYGVYNLNKLGQCSDISGDWIDGECRQAGENDKAGYSNDA